MALDQKIYNYGFNSRNEFKSKWEKVVMRISMWTLIVVVIVGSGVASLVPADTSIDTDSFEQSHPTSANDYYIRGFREYKKDHFVSAINDFTESLALKSENPEAYSARGVASHLAGRYDDAIKDYLKVIELQPESSDRFHLFIWLAKAAKLKDLRLANGELANYVHHAVPPKGDDGFQFNIEKFVLGELSAADLLKVANSPKYVEDLKNYQCQAHFYIGMIAVFENDKVTARDHLEQAVQGITAAWQNSLENKMAINWLAIHKMVQPS